MNPDHMVHMANQIANFFASFPHEEAVAGVTDHIQKFWAPPMRMQLHNYIAQGSSGLHELVIEAEKQVRK